MNQRILVNARSLSSPVTGVQRYLQELLARLPADQMEVVSPQFARHGFAGHLWEQSVLPIKVGPRLLWSPTNTGPLAVKRQVVTIHDVSVLEHPEWFSRVFSTWYRFLLPRLAQKANKIFTVSEFSRSRIVQLCQVDAHKVVVIHNAADARFVPRPSEEVSKVCQRLQIPSRRYVLALGSLEPRKNLPRLLRAWKDIQPQLPRDLWLVLAGPKGQSLVFGNVFLENLPPNVFLPGYVAEECLPALYSGAVAFVFPSLYEGFGLPPLEAMACSTPVIASNTTSLPEVVGDAALTVEPLVVGEIAEAIQRLVTDEDLRSSLAKKGLERASLFSWEQAAALTWDVLKEAAESFG